MKAIVTILLLATASMVMAQSDTPAVSPPANLLQLLLGLALVIVLIFVLLWLIKRIGYNQYQASGIMKIKSCLPVSPKEKLLLVEVGNEHILIGVAPGNISHIKTFEQPITGEATASILPSAFADKLKAILHTNTDNGSTKGEKNSAVAD